MRYVYLLGTNDSWGFSENLAPRERLINCVLLETGRASQLHNPAVRSELDGQIETCGRNDRTIAIGDYATLNS